MSLVVNHNMMAANTARNLNAHYGRLGVSTQRLSTGLRINSAADDAAGLAIRELQRSDIAAFQQGSRNANDAISMIQVADGSLGVIDEKLIRMKELAEQAATGTYDSTQRLMIDSEYQAMASEITRIANATDFNGIKLLDGTLSGVHNGKGNVEGRGINSTGKMKIHFGTGNDSAEDYYYITIGNCTAAALGVGNSAVTSDGKYYISTTKTTLADGTVVKEAGADQYVKEGDATASTVAGDVFDVYGDAATTGRYYWDGAAVQELVAATAPATAPTDQAGVELLGPSKGDNGEPLVTDETDVYWKPQYVSDDGTDTAVTPGTPVTTTTTKTEVFKEEAYVDTNGTPATVDTTKLTAVYNDGTADFYMAGDGKYYRVDATPATEYTPAATLPFTQVTGTYGPKFVEQTTGAPAADLSGNVVEKAEYRYEDGTYLTAAEAANVTGSEEKAADGATVSTQEAAQKALVAINNAIVSKDKIRAHLGALQNRLENTITNLNVMAENLQAAESRISDVDVATEMTQFVRNQILTQSAVAMLGQANSLPQMAMQLIGG